MISYESYDTNGFEISEIDFDAQTLGKYESIFCQGNGYMGLRAALEEPYTGETRDLFVTGTFNKYDDREVSELPNAADVTALDLRINGTVFSLIAGEVLECRRTLNLRTGELTRNVVWRTEATGRVRLQFSRFVSLVDLHLIGQHVTITALDRELDLVVQFGIDGQMTNSGVSHFSHRFERVPDNHTMQLVQTTTESNIAFALGVRERLSIGEENPVLGAVASERRRIHRNYHLCIPLGRSVNLEKVIAVHTSRDNDQTQPCTDEGELADENLRYLDAHAAKGYRGLLARSAEAWDERVWNRFDIRLDSEDCVDALAIRFAQYHLTVMTPAHDTRMSIGAKGLSGEGYKGHAFWDTEIFMLPYFTFTNPEIARGLLEYRYLGLPSARRKARENGYRGAMYPWESAWIDDGETTPEFGGLDIVTGDPIRIWCGILEHHVTADVAYGVSQYYEATGDDEFMERAGYEIIFEAATFWASRVEWDTERGAYCINDVIGPDEYKEHVNNNAFTNYAAWWCLRKALECAGTLRKSRPEVFDRLDRQLDLQTVSETWRERADRLYLPQPGENGVLPQDDTYMSLEQVDLSKYRTAKIPVAIFREHSLEQINRMQVSKQADVILLLYLFPNLFDARVKQACWDYYEPRALHDSSLSLSSHCLSACALGEIPMAYEFFKRVTFIDMGPNMTSSDAGIHAASLGGLWECVILGFGGVRSGDDGILSVNPRLPENWRSIAFAISWQGTTIDISLNHERVTIRAEAGSDNPLEIEIAGKTHLLRGELTVEYDE